MKIKQNMSLGIVLWLLLAATCYGADDYMSALEAEADETGGSDGQTPLESPVRKKSSVLNRDSIRPDLVLGEFEEELDANYSGSYSLYRNLNKYQRKAVFKFYQQDNQVESIRKEIVRQLSSG